MNSQEFASLLRILLAVVGGMLTQHGLASHEQVTQAASDITTIAPALLSLGSIAWSVYAHWNMKKVPENSIAVHADDVKGGAAPGASVVPVRGTMTVVGALLLCFFISEARAAPKLTGDPIKDFAAIAPKPVTASITPQGVIQKILGLAQVDLVYSIALAKSANTASAKVRLQCLQAISDFRDQVSGSTVKDATGAVIPEPPAPHVFTDLEKIAEGIDALAPTGPLMTSCAGVAGMLSMNVVTAINAIVSGTAAAALIP